MAIFGGGAPPSLPAALGSQAAGMGPGRVAVLLEKTILDLHNLILAEQDPQHRATFTQCLARLEATRSNKEAPPQGQAGPPQRSQGY